MSDEANRPMPERMASLETEFRIVGERMGKLDDIHTMQVRTTTISEEILRRLQVGDTKLDNHEERILALENDITKIRTDLDGDDDGMPSLKKLQKSHIKGSTIFWIGGLAFTIVTTLVVAGSNLLSALFAAPKPH
jgi:hypothetical protein